MNLLFTLVIGDLIVQMYALYKGIFLSYKISIWVYDFIAQITSGLLRLVFRLLSLHHKARQGLLWIPVFVLVKIVFLILGWLHYQNINTTFRKFYELVTYNLLIILQPTKQIYKILLD